MPNPADSDDDYKKMIYDRLARMNQAAPGIAEKEIDATSDAAGNVARNQLYSSLAQAAGQIGTVGGKAASAAPVQQMAQGLDQAGAMGLQGVKEQAGNLDKERDNLYKFLAQQTKTEFDKQGRKERLDESKRHNQEMETLGGRKADISENIGQQKVEVSKTKGSGDPLKSERDWATKEKTAIKGDKQLQDAYGTLGAIDEAMPMIDDAVENPGSANALGPVLARVLSHGQRINMPEIQSQEGGSRGFFDRINTIATRAESGKITTDQAGYLKRAFGILGNGAKKIKEDREGSHVGEYRALSPTKADEATTRQYLGLSPAAAAQAQAPAASAPKRTVSADELTEYAKTHSMDEDKAKEWLTSQGYQVP